MTKSFFTYLLISCLGIPAFAIDPQCGPDLRFLEAKVPPHLRKLVTPEIAQQITQRTDQSQVIFLPRDEVLRALKSMTDKDQGSLIQDLFGDAQEITPEMATKLPKNLKDNLDQYFQMLKAEQAIHLPFERGDATYRYTIEGFLNRGLTKRALFKTAQLGHFQEYLDTFFVKTVAELEESKEVRVIQLANGDQATISASRQVLRGGEPGPTISIKVGDVNVEIQKEGTEGANTKYLVQAVKGEGRRRKFLSGIEYQTLTFAETKNRREAQEKQVMAKLKERMKSDPVFAAEIRKFFAALPGPEETPSQSGEHVVEDSTPVDPTPIDQIPLVSFNSIGHEADGRVEWPTLNSGNSLEGYKILAMVLDQIKTEGKNSEAIKAVQKYFRFVQVQLIEEYLGKRRIVEAYQNLLSVIQADKNDPQLKSSQVQITPTEKLDQRAFELANEVYYVPAIKEDSHRLQTLGKAENHWLTMRAGHYFQMTSIAGLKRGELIVYMKNMQKERDWKIYKFVIGADGRVKSMPTTDERWSYIGVESFLQFVEP